MTALRALLRERASARAVGVARIGVGIAAVMKAVERYPVLERVNDPEIIRVPYVTGQPSLADLPASLVVGAWLALAVAFLVGFRTTAAGVGLAAVIGLVLFSDQQLYSNHLYLLLWLVGLLTIARAGSALSLDAIRSGERATVPAWPVALIRLQVIVVYFFAGLAKINAEYLSGSVVASSLRETGPLALPEAWQSFQPMAMLSVLSIVTELGLAVGLTLPRWRRTAFVVALGLHASIAIWLEPTIPLVIFGVMTLSPFVLFLDARPGRIVVVWDDSCGFCSAWVRWFRRLDWLRALRFVPGSDAAALHALGLSQRDADRAMQVLAPSERSEGFRGVITILEALPLTFLWAPLFRLWPVQRLGSAAYRRVAASRTCSTGLRPAA